MKKSCHLRWDRDRHDNHEPKLLSEAKYFELVFSREYVSAITPSSVSDVASISLDAGVLLSSTAEVAHLLSFSPVVADKTGAVSITGSDGPQTLIGTRGDDSLAGGKGSDIHTGGAGVDTFTLQDNESVTDFAFTRSRLSRGV